MRHRRRTTNSLAGHPPGSVENFGYNPSMNARASCVMIFSRPLGI